MIKEIDIQELISIREAGEPLALIDIRSPMEVVQGSIPGSENIPMNQLPEVMEQFKQHQRVVLFCRSGARSAHACAYLINNGIDNVINLRGGIMAWAQSGQGIE